MQRAEWLTDEQNELLEQAVAAIRKGVGEKLTGVMLVGPAVKPARHDGELPLRLVVTVTTLPVATLSNLAHQAHGVAEQGVELRVLTKAELLRSTDVFALELADYQRRHFLLDGVDPLKDLHLTQADLRMAIERQLRLSARSVRHTILSGLKEDGHLDIITARLRVIVDDVVTIADHLLRMLGEDPPTPEQDILAQLGKHTGSDVDLLLTAVGQIRTDDDDPLQRPAAALAELAALIDAATITIDRFGAAAD